MKCKKSVFKFFRSKEDENSNKSSEQQEKVDVEISEQVHELPQSTNKVCLYIQILYILFSQDN